MLLNDGLEELEDPEELKRSRMLDAMLDSLDGLDELDELEELEEPNSLDGRRLSRI